MMLTALGAVFMVVAAKAPLSAGTQVMLTHLCERTEPFAKVEDALFALLDVAVDTDEAVEIGITFNDRLHGQSDAALVTDRPCESEFMS
jgi:hypothetical protein